MWQNWAAETFSITRCLLKLSRQHKNEKNKFRNYRIYKLVKNSELIWLTQLKKQGAAELDTSWVQEEQRSQAP